MSSTNFTRIEIDYSDEKRSGVISETVMRLNNSRLNNNSTNSSTSNSNSTKTTHHSSMNNQTTHISPITNIGKNSTKSTHNANSTIMSSQSTLHNNGNSGSSTSGSTNSSTHSFHNNQNQQIMNSNNNGIEISNLSHSELVGRVKKLEMDLLKLASDHNHMIREANHHIQTKSVEINTLKTNISRLEEDNTELRDLCCFLDDDRQKGRKLAREWQRFGRYTATVMRQEVAAYQSKLRELDTKQQQLVTDNTELKELCLYLDEERNQNFCTQCGAAFRRDDGDGSSSGTNPTEEYPPPQITPPHSETINNLHSTNNDMVDMRDDISRGVLGSQIVEYVRRLERRVIELEKEETISCPDSVLNALQVLQVCQGLDDHDIGDQEKAIVRQMCNVVWKKLEETPKL